MGLEREKKHQFGVCSVFRRYYSDMLGGVRDSGLGIREEVEMTASKLAVKMKLKPGHRAALVNAPNGYAKELSPLPAGAKIAPSLAGVFDWIQLFAKDEAELKQLLPRAVKALKVESILWLSFPKGGSKIQTDLTRDKGWDALQTFDIKWVTLISVNDTWSAFAVRPYRAGEANQNRG